MKNYGPRLLFGKLYLLLLCFIPIGIAAQDTLPPPGHFEVEVEPAAFIFTGYAINFGYQTGPLRISIKSFAVNQPRIFVGNQHFAIQSSGIGFEIDYLFRRGSTPFFGLLSDYHSDQLFGRSSSNAGLQNSVSAGARLGYRYFFGSGETGERGFYLSSSVSVFTKLDAKDLIIAGESYAPRTIYTIPAINVGYRF